MKYILTILLLLSVNLFSDNKQKVTIGFGPYIQSQPYKDVDDLILASPVLFYDNGIFYVRWSRFGLYFLGDKGDELSWGFSLSAQPRTNGYNPDDSSSMAGMDEKESSWEGGLAFSASWDDSYVEMMFLHDLLNKYDSYIAKIELGHFLEYEKISFYPSIVAVYQSDDFLNYYYGVTNKESINSSFDVYSADAGFKFALQTYIKHPITEDFSAFFNARIDLISDEAKNSPLTNKDYYYSGLASIIYTFEY